MHTVSEANRWDIAAQKQGAYGTFTVVPTGDVRQEEVISVYDGARFLAEVFIRYISAKNQYEIAVLVPRLDSDELPPPPPISAEVWLTPDGKEQIRGLTTYKLYEGSAFVLSTSRLILAGAVNSLEAFGRQRATFGFTFTKP